MRRRLKLGDTALIALILPLLGALPCLSVRLPIGNLAFLSGAGQWHLGAGHDTAGSSGQSAATWRRAAPPLALSQSDAGNVSLFGGTPAEVPRKSKLIAYFEWPLR